MRSTDRLRPPRLSGIRARLAFVLATLAAVHAFATGSSAPTWQCAADLPRGCAFPNQTPQLIGRKLYLLAGANYRIDQLLTYDLDTGIWSTKPTALLTSRHHFATAVFGGKLYVAGGCLGESDAVPHRRTDAVESYDPATELWTPRSPMPLAREGCDLVPFENELLAIGGTDKADVPTNRIEAYDPTSDTWRVKAIAPWREPLMWTHAVVHCQRIYVFGRTQSAIFFLAYDPSANTFTELPVGRIAEKRAYGTALAGDVLLLVGGAQKAPVATVVGYDLAQDRWGEYPALPQPRAYAAVTQFEKRIFCMGGTGPDWDWAHPNTSVFVLELPPPPASTN